MSLEWRKIEKKCNWTKTNEHLAKAGDGWRLPTLEEYKALFLNRKPLRSGVYWTSEQVDPKQTSYPQSLAVKFQKDTFSELASFHDEENHCYFVRDA